MEGSIKIVNELLVELFNDILNIEKESLKKGHFSDLSITEMHVLEAIGLEDRTMTEVASQIGITVGTLTTSINRLVKKEYVLRERSETDRRYVEIRLSKKGKLAYRVHEAFHEKMVRTMTDNLSDQDNEVLIASMQRLNQFFKDNYSVLSKKDPAKSNDK